MPQVVLKNGSKTADLEQEHLVALINRMVDYNTPEDESAALFEVLYASKIQLDWMTDARHFNWWSPIEGPRPKFVFPESYGLPR